MGFFDSIVSLSRAAVGTAMLPLDVMRDVGRVVLLTEDDPDCTDRRLEKIGRNLDRAVEEIDED